MSPKWKWFIPGYVWSLPLTIVGLILAKFVYKSTDFIFDNGLIRCVAGRCEDGSTRIWGKPAGQTFGIVQIYSSVRNSQYIPLGIHETAHTVQAFVGGVFFAVLYGLFFLFFFAKNGFKNWYSAYEKNPFERHANAVEDAYRLMAVHNDTTRDSKFWF